MASDGGGDERVRAFFALELDAGQRAEARTVVAALRDRLGGPGGPDGLDAASLRWMRPEGWHVTLRFLGNTPRAQIGEIAREARAALAEHAPFALRLGGVVAFPAHRPRVLALEVAPPAPLAALAAALEKVSVVAGFAPEARRFRPHLTLARARDRRRGLGAGPDVERALGDVSSAPAAASTVHCVQTVREAVLLRSETRPDGARYTPLERIALGGADHP